MDYAQPNIDPETIGEVTATQIQDPTQIIVQPDLQNTDQVKQELHKFSIKNSIIRIEKFGLRLLSYVLLIHGINGIYNEVIELFYVFPHLPQVFEDINYSEVAYQSLYRKTLLITATAAIETIYGLALMARLKHLVHRLHIITAIAMLVISYLIAKQTVSLESLDVNHRIPHHPSTQNILKSGSVANALELFVPQDTKESNSKSQH